MTYVSPIYSIGAVFDYMRDTKNPEVSKSDEKVKSSGTLECNLKAVLLFLYNEYYIIISIQ